MCRKGLIFVLDNGNKTPITKHKKTNTMKAEIKIQLLVNELSNLLIDLTNQKFTEDRPKSCIQSEIYFLTNLINELTEIA